MSTKSKSTKPKSTKSAKTKGDFAAFADRKLKESAGQKETPLTDLFG